MLMLGNMLSVNIIQEKSLEEPGGGGGGVGEGLAWKQGSRFNTHTTMMYICEHLDFPFLAHKRE